MEKTKDKERKQTKKFKYLNECKNEYSLSSPLERLLNLASIEIQAQLIFH